MNDTEHFKDLFSWNLGLGYKQFVINFADLGQFEVELNQNSKDLYFW